MDSHREVVIWVHQPGDGSHDAVPVRIRIVGEGYLVFDLSGSTSRAIAYGLEQSMRILPSWSTVMNEKVGSMVGLTTTMSSP